ncbi:MAG TPA: FCD domain-containing protein, partial [Acidimicrobiales bacterium]|nr:FCD domain-containing protein [Acidimicrobiales bacterium]
EVQDLVEVREHLEVLAASLAARRASRQDVQRLKAHVEQMRRCETVEDFVEADLAFHLETALIARNGVLQSLLDSIRSLLRAWFDRTLRVEGTMSATLKEHEEVFDAIRRRSAADAEQAMKLLMDRADQRLKDTL